MVLHVEQLPVFRYLILLRYLFSVRIHIFRGVTVCGIILFIYRIGITGSQAIDMDGTGILDGILRFHVVLQMCLRYPSALFICDDNLIPFTVCAFHFYMEPEVFIYLAHISGNFFDDGDIVRCVMLLAVIIGENQVRFRVLGIPLFIRHRLCAEDIFYIQAAGIIL